jgi:selenoprotein W-related protein
MRVLQLRLLVVLALIALTRSLVAVRIPCGAAPVAVRAPAAQMQALGSIKSPRLAIEYCTRCNWMLRSAWMAQELLTTFNGTVGEVALIPNHKQGGIFEVSLLTSEGEIMLYSRATSGTFPESKELKQLVRDAIDPGRDLGHSDDDERVKVRSSATTALQRLMGSFGLDGGRAR